MTVEKITNDVIAGVVFNDMKMEDDINHFYEYEDDFITKNFPGAKFNLMDDVLIKNIDVIGTVLGFDVCKGQFEYYIDKGADYSDDDLRYEWFIQKDLEEA